jgi:hypothetical protein
MSTPNPIKCANLACKVAEDNRCVEGLDLNVCPHYGKDPIALPADGPLELEHSPTSLISLSHAGSLTAKEASVYLRRGEARTISILGTADAGKTSLIACAYDLFQSATFEGLRFGGSDTLHAFEQVCHDARQASRRGTPHTDRTPIGDSRFYHIDVSVDGSREPLAILLADRAGEEYLEAANDIAIAKRFNEVKRADTILVLVDGKKMIDNGARHNAQSDVLNMLQALWESDTFRTGQRLGLVLTKFDLISGEQSNDRTLRDFERLVTKAKAIVGDLFSDIATFQVAASPQEKDTMRGAGVAELLRYCLNEASNSLPTIREEVEFSRSFARLRYT